MIFPHGFQVDKDGNVWVADERAATPEELAKFPDARGKGNRVIKFSPEGKILLTIGRGGAPGDPPEATIADQVHSPGRSGTDVPTLGLAVYSSTPRTTSPKTSVSRKSRPAYR